MESGAQQGDDEGIGGVVTPSHRTGGVVVSSVGGQYQISNPDRAELTPIVQLLEQAGCEQRPSRCGKLGTRRLSALRQGWTRGMWLPLVHVQVRRHVGGEAGRGRRSPHGLHGEVVGAARLLHAQVSEVEVLGSHGM
jgi:hypothetical protein